MKIYFSGITGCISSARRAGGCEYLSRVNVGTVYGIVYASISDIPRSYSKVLLVPYPYPFSDIKLVFMLNS